MPKLGSLVVSAVAFALWASLPGCSAETSAGEPENVRQSQEAVMTIVCKITNTCCASTATGVLPWDLTNPLEAQLSAWSCTRPRLYQPNQAANAWWYYSQCTDANHRVESLLAANPQYVAAPYLATVSTTLDKACVSTPPAGSVDVLWDPTCPTCLLR